MKKLYIQADFKNDDMLRFRLVEMTEKEYEDILKDIKEIDSKKYRTIIVPATTGISFEPFLSSFTDD